MLELFYAGVARWRRRAVERRPGTRRRLDRPVISIGNLSVGGTGKTPVVAAVTRWLLEHGHRPSILSRGYKRREPLPGVVVVSDGGDVLTSLSRAGDEPLMLARAVPGAVVCVAEDRYLAGVLAERQLGATVHVLDDGFQHFALARDLDVLVTTPGEIPHGRVLPRGRLREPGDAAARAHLLVVVGATAGAAASEAWTLGISEACGAVRRVGEPRPIGNREPGAGGRIESGSEGWVRPGARVMLVAGIANPQRFADDVRAAGWMVVGEQWFADHHPFTARDIASIATRAAERGAEAVFTTDKDAVRLEALDAPFPLFRLPITLEFDPPTVLFDRLATLLAISGADGEGETSGAASPAGQPQPDVQAGLGPNAGGRP